MSGTPAFTSESAARTVLRGAAANALGLVARVLDPLFEIFVARVLGAGVFAVYKTALPLVESAATLTVAGYQDGIVALAGRHVETEAEAPRVYQIFANALVVTLAVSIVVCTGSVFLGPAWLAARFSPGLVRDGLIPAVQLMAFTVPCLAVINMVSAATRSLLIMRYHASLGAARTVLLFAMTAAGAVALPRIVALPVAYLAANLVLVVVAGAIYQRHFSVERLGHALRRFEWSGELTRFAIPQNLNMALNTLLPSMGALMLGLRGARVGDIALFAAGAGMLQTIRQIRIIGSSAFAPMVVRLHAQGQRLELQHTMSRMMGWTMRLALPAILGVLVFRRELISLYGLGQVGADYRFMLVLGVVPVINCFAGYAGNVVVMTGHSRWNLFNSSVGIAVAGFLCWTLIPVYGLLGAALGSAASGVIVGGLELWEAGRLAGVRPESRFVAGSLLAGLAGGVAVVLVEIGWHPAGLPGHLVQATLGGGAYLLVLWLTHQVRKEREAGS